MKDGYNMCLAIPAKIIKINGNIAEVESLGVRKEVDISLLPEIKINDFVIVHAGFAIQIIDSKEALITQGYWKEYFSETGEETDDVFFEEFKEKDDLQ